MSISSENSDEFYVMPAFVTLAVRDVQTSAKWYQEVLNFRTLFEVPGQLVHLRREKYQDILLKPGAVTGEERSVRAGEGASLCYSVGAPADVDRLAAQAREKHAAIVEGPVNRPWNVRELILLDPDGYRVVLSGGPVEERSFEDIFPLRTTDA